MNGYKHVIGSENIDLNYVRWPNLEVKVWADPDFGSDGITVLDRTNRTYADEVSTLRSWIEHRIAYLDGALASLSSIRALM